MKDVNDPISCELDNRIESIKTFKIESREKSYQIDRDINTPIASDEKILIESFDQNTPVLHEHSNATIL